MTNRCKSAIRAYNFGPKMGGTGTGGVGTGGGGGALGTGRPGLTGGSTLSAMTKHIFRQSPRLVKL